MNKSNFFIGIVIVLLIPLFSAVGCHPPNVDIKANGSDGPITIAYNTSANLSWTSANVNTCYASGSWSGSKSISSSSEPTGNLTSSKTYTITCTGVEGIVSDSVTVNVEPAPLPPTVDIKANGSDGPITIAYNTSANLSWTSTNATTCSASNAWSGSKSISGSEGTGSLISSKTYTIVCTGAGGSATDSVTVNVDGRPTLSVDLQAIPNSGIVPLNDVDLVATVSGTATGSINYKFDCTNNGSWDYEYNGINDNPKTVVDACDYVSAGTYIAKVYVERGEAVPAQDTAVVVVSNPLTFSPTVNIKANGSDGPITIAYNTSANLSWVSTNASVCSASGDWSGSKSISGSENTGNLTASQTYIITCTGAGGWAIDSVTVNVQNQVLSPTVNIKANGSDGPITINYNTSANLSWTSTNANTCYAYGSWSGSKSISGSENTGNLTSSRTYSITCTGTGGSATDSVTVNVQNQVLSPTVDIKANGSDGPITINYNTSANLTWNSANANTCYASNAWSGSKSIYGSETSNSLVSSKTYTITCTGAGGSVSDNVTVNVGSQPTGFTIEKKAKNISNGETNWQEIVSADPGDKIAFQISIYNPGNEIIRNIIVKDSALSDKIAWRGNLKVDGVSHGGDIEASINIDYISPAQTKEITFEILLEEKTEFVYGITTLINTALAYSTAWSRTDTATLKIKNSDVKGIVTEVPTGVLDDAVMSLGITFGITYCLLLGFFFYKKMFPQANLSLAMDKGISSFQAKAETWLYRFNPLQTIERSEKELNKTLKEIRNQED